MADLVAEGLVKRFGRHAVLSGVDLCVASGTLTTLLGASGSGKTTLLRLVCGFERVNAGTIRLDDRLVSGPAMHLPPERRHIGYVAQDGALFPHLSVAENIVFGLPRRERSSHTTVDRLLALVRLKSAYATRRPHQLSGGEQQRVALARALAAQPRIVLLDEPFSSLDAALRVETRQVVSDAIAEAKATALLVTHDQSEALSMGSRVAVLRDGRMVQVDTPEALYRRPVDADLARFVGEAVVVRGDARGGRVACAFGDLSLAEGMPGGPVDVMIRPEQICLVGDTEAAGVPAKVAAVTFYGHDASVAMNLDGASSTRVTARLPGHVVVRPGDRVRVVVTGEVVAYALPSAGLNMATHGTQANEQAARAADHAVTA